MTKRGFLCERNGAAARCRERWRYECRSERGWSDEKRLVRTWRPQPFSTRGSRRRRVRATRSTHECQRGNPGRERRPSGAGPIGALSLNWELSRSLTAPLPSAAASRYAPDATGREGGSQPRWSSTGMPTPQEKEQRWRRIARKTTGSRRGTLDDAR